jgi:pimeloyl-ACP methyl ester carboxylesterase
MSSILFWVSLSISLVYSCKFDRPDSMVIEYTNSVLDSCIVEPDHHFHITLPDHLSSEQKIPLVIVIDPHGDGLLGMQKFRDALKDVPCVIAGSDKLRNNYGGFETSLTSLHRDLIRKYPVDPQKVIVAGFSGGARMAMYYGLKHPVNGIIMFGAGPGKLSSEYQKTLIYAVSGTRDFNFIEQYRPLFFDIHNPPSYVTDYFRGMHNWPPEQYIREAAVYCLRDGPEPFPDLSLGLSRDFLEEYDSLQHEADLFFAGKALEKAWYFAAGTPQQKLLSRKINEFKNSTDWINYQEKMASFLRSEESMKRSYAAKLADPDTTWWNMELNRVFTSLDVSIDPVEQDYFYRLKGFLGIYLYSRINGLLLEQNSSTLMDRLLAIYERVEPDSEDLVHFKTELTHLREPVSE